MRLALALLAVLACSGCGTTERTGGVGDTLDGRYVAATLLDFRDRVPTPKQPDVTGFDAPGKGNRFTAARVSVCTDHGQAIRGYDFLLAFDGGEARPKQPQSLFDDDFDVVRDDCERGWLVYAIPAEAEADELVFEYDNTGSGGGVGRPGDRESHLRFVWDVG